MENEVVVSRARRGKRVEEIRQMNFFADIETGELFLRLQRNGIRDNDAVRIGTQDKTVAYVLSYVEAPAFWEGRRFHEFDSPDDMCKWVAGGRKLEDLQGDAKREWEELHTLGIGDFFTEEGVVYMVQNFGLGSGQTTTVEAWRFDSMDCVEFNNARMVWPIRFDLGDTITIKGK